MVLYTTFQDMVESHVQVFLKEKGMSAEEFAAVCESEQEREGGDSHPFVLWMLASTSYEQFWKMMVEEKERG